MEINSIVKETTEITSDDPHSDYKMLFFFSGQHRRSRCCTFYSQSDLFQSSVLQHRLGHVSVLYVFEEAVQFGAVDDCWEMKVNTLTKISSLSRNVILLISENLFLNLSGNIRSCDFK